MQKVELHAAFSYDCDECGRESFVNAVCGDLDEAIMRENSDQVAASYEATEYEELESGEYDSPFLIQRITLVPRSVHCKFCGANFGTSVFNEDEENDD